MSYSINTTPLTISDPNPSIMRRINAMRPYFSNVSSEDFDVRRANFLHVNREKAREEEHV